MAARAAELPSMLGRVLVYIRSTDGGISNYTHAQAMELQGRGCPVVVLATHQFVAEHDNAPYGKIEALLSAPKRLTNTLLRKVIFVAAVIWNPFVLAFQICKHRPRFVLLDAVSELMAPIWFLPHLLLARVFGVIYVVTLHDPVRNRLFGPAWWHRLSVWAAYRPISIGLIHDAAERYRDIIPAHVQLVEVPHGLFPAAAGSSNHGQLRAELGVPQDATVALSFGYLVDRKNLDLAIRAITKLPKLHLVAVGRRGSSQDRPHPYYRQLAADLGVADRCHIIDRFVAESEIGQYFAAADFVLMTYCGEFVSQSGVLHIAANWDKPVLASAGRGPLLEVVSSFGLGLVVEPDSVDALAEGMSVMLSSGAAAPGWQQFREYASWSRNVDLLLDAVEKVERRP